MRLVIALPVLVAGDLLPAAARPRARASRSAPIRPNSVPPVELGVRSRELQAPVHRRSLPRGLAVLAAHRRHLDARRAAAGLSHGLRHRPRRAAPPAAAADAGRAAVLDVVPDPRLRLDGTVVGERHPEPVPALVRPRRRSRHHPRHRMGDLSRHRLRLPAVHGAAALCRAGKARLGLARGGVRPRRPAAAAFLTVTLPCRCPASSPAACWCSSRRSASS